MIFVFEEGIHITVSGLTRYVHPGERCTSFCRLQILEVDFVSFYPDLDVSRGRLFL